MTYDIFNTYKRRLNESSERRFKDVKIQDMNVVNTKSLEEMFDEAFNNVYGIDSDCTTVEELNEDFGTFPDWLKSYLSKNKSLRDKLSKNGLDLANATFISGQLPRNARDAAFRDPSRIAVFRMVDSVDGKYEVIYIPGFTDPDVYPDPNNRWTRYSASSISKKKLLELTLEYGYIDMNDKRNSNTELRKERADAKKGMIDRDRSAGQVPKITNVKYGTYEDGSTNWDDVVSYDIKWVTKRGYDKSGYPLDPDKYGRMLDNAGLSDYSVRLEMLYNNLEKVRARLITNMQKYTVTDSTKFRTDGWEDNLFGSLSDAARFLSRAIDSYVRLEKRVKAVVENEEDTDEEKNRSIASAFSWTSKDVRSYLKDANETLRKVETAQPRDSQ